MACTALVFPGQGSQRPGAGIAWQQSPGWALVEQAGQVLGRDLAPLLLTWDAEQLRPTGPAQLATFLSCLLAWRGVQEQAGCGLNVTVFAGHSLGELTALVAAGAIGFEDGVRLVAERGAAMQAAAEASPGTMVAVLGLDDATVAEALAGVEGAWTANHNAPLHVVVSGTVNGIAAATVALKAAGARRVLPLPVGGAFHTPLMAPAQRRLDQALQGTAYAPPLVPVLSAVTAAPYGADSVDNTDSADSVAGMLSRQLTAPVRWRQLLETLPGRGIERIVELGPGGVLAGLAKRTVPQLTVMTVASPADLSAL